MLFLQKLFGTRFLLPKFYRPITFDYYDVRKLMEHEKNQLESVSSFKNRLFALFAL